MIILFGVVGTHLFLVDVFLKDVAEDIRVDLVIVPQGTVVKVPLVLLKKLEKLLECLVGDLNGFRHGGSQVGVFEKCRR